MAVINGKNVVLSANITGLVDIDHEYNPESENPISGKGVAQALAGFEGGGGSGSGTDAKLRKDVTNAIGEITLEETIVYDIDTDEAAYNYAVSVGSYKVADGVFNSAQANAKTTEKIPVKVGEKYTIEGFCNANYALISEFDNNQNWIASYGATQLKNYTFASTNPYIYTVPAGVSHVAFSTADKTKANLKVIGTVTRFRNVDDIVSEAITPVNAEVDNIRTYAENEAEKTKRAFGENIFIEDLTDTLVIETGGLNATNGKIITATTLTDARTTQPFKVEKGEIYHIWGSYNSAYSLIALYDENLNFIVSVHVGSENSVTKIENEVYVIPDTATDSSGNEKKVAYMACGTKQISKALGVDLSVKREVTEYKNAQETIANAISDFSANKLDKVLFSPNGNEWVLTITNDGEIKAVKRRNTGGDIATTLTLPATLPFGTYALKYENAQGALTEYANICSIEIPNEGEAAVYNGLIAENCAPSNATSIGVYNSEGVRAGGIELGFLQNDYSERLYSFGAISDIHIGQGDSVEDFTNAVDFFDNNSDVDFVTICGDMVDDASKDEQLVTYKGIAKGAKKPIYVVTGNHEALKYKTGENFDNIKEYFAQDNFPSINQDLYYSFTRGNDIFIMLGVYGSYEYNETFSARQLQWLYETLETNRNKRCFLFLHYFPRGGSGDAINCYKSDGLKGSKGQVFYNLMQHYKNVIYFHGHSHAKFKVQELNSMNTIDKIFGRYSVHIPSLMWTTYPDESMTEYIKDSSTGEGYVVDVYENGVALRGRDFENNLYSPIGSYYLDTVIQKVEANTFYDSTGTIATPILSAATE